MEHQAQGSAKRSDSERILNRTYDTNYGLPPQAYNLLGTQFPIQLAAFSKAYQASFKSY